MDAEVESLKHATIKEKLELMLDIGQLMMESGSDSKSIVRDMLRAAAYLGLHWKHINFHMTYTTIMVNYDNEAEAYTIYRKCRRHGINMSAIIDVSRVSWRAIEKKYVIQAFKAELDRIRLEEQTRHYSPLVTSIAAGFACGGFCKLFGCDWAAFFYTALAACVGFWGRRWCNLLGVNFYISTAAAACVATIAAYFTSFLPGSATPWFPMIACMLFLVPGIPLINSFDDLMNNYALSGATRAIHTLLIVFAMTFGIVCAISVCDVPHYAAYSIVPSGLDGSQAIAAAVAAMGFSVIFNIPPKLLPVVAVGAIIAVGTRNILSLGFGMSQAWASFMGAAVMGIIGYKFAHWIHVPHMVVTIPAVIPMIPGVLMYRLLIGLFDITALNPQEFLGAMQAGVKSFLIIFAIAVGATIPEMLAHQCIERSKQRRLQRMLAASRGSQESMFETETDIDQASNLK